MATSEPTETELLFEKLSTFIWNKQHKKALKAAQDSKLASRCRDWLYGGGAFPNTRDLDA